MNNFAKLEEFRFIEDHHDCRTEISPFERLWSLLVLDRDRSGVAQVDTLKGCNSLFVDC